MWLAENALNAADKAAKLTSQLLGFARNHHFDSKPLDPVEVIDGLRDLLVRAAGDRITLHADVSECEIAACLADQNQLECALLNLVINARDAIAGAAGPSRSPCGLSGCRLLRMDGRSTAPTFV